MSSNQTYSRATLLRRRIFRIDRLGAMPNIVWKLVEALGDEKTDASQLEQLIEGDPALTSKILSLANSAYYGRALTVTTISRAIVVMGFQELQILAVGAGLADMFNLKKLPSAVDGDGLWLHSLAVSWASRALAEESGYPLPAEIMIAGLLHDLGKLILAAHLTDEYLGVMEKTAKGVPYYLAEEELELKHTVIGYWLAERWGLPEVHKTVIRDHHGSPDTSSYFLPTALVALANGLVKYHRVGVCHETRKQPYQNLLAAVKLSKKQLETISGQFAKKLPQLLETWRQLMV